MPRHDGHDAPLVSFGLPVRDGAATIAQAIESVQAQTLGDWELVISDNLSSDETPAICTAYAATDARIRYLPTKRDLSQNDNFTASFRVSRGTYFRWYGDDDWLEPEYAERAVAALEESPSAVLCTTAHRYYRGDEHVPENDAVARLGGVMADDAVERVRSLLRLFERGGHLGIDPVYALVRRSVAARTRLIEPIRFGDFVFSCEMALLGPFTHVPQPLAHRRLAAVVRNLDEHERFTSRGGWGRYAQREVAVQKVMRASRHLPLGARARLAVALAAFTAREHCHGLRRRISTRT